MTRPALGKPADAVLTPDQIDAIGAGHTAVLVVFIDVQPDGTCRTRMEGGGDQDVLPMFADPLNEVLRKIINATSTSKVEIDRGGR